LIASDPGVWNDRIYRQPTIDEIDAVLADYVKRVQQTDLDFTGTNGKIIQTTQRNLIRCCENYRKSGLMNKEERETERKNKKSSFLLNRRYRINQNKIFVN
jgi:hypothetical protein